MLDPPWSLERGLSILADGDSPEARLLDAMDLLVGFHAESEDAVIGPVETQLVSGRTELIRTKAASSLVLLMSPAGFGTLESSLPGLDEETRGFAERLLNVPGVTKARAGKAMSERSLERHRHHTSKRIEKVSRLTRRRQEKLRRGLMRFDVNVDDLEREPVVSPDLAPGGIGYRLDFVPRNEQAATFTIWVVRTESASPWVRARHR